MDRNEKYWIKNAREIFLKTPLLFPIFFENMKPNSVCGLSASAAYTLVFTVNHIKAGFVRVIFFFQFLQIYIFCNWGKTIQVDFPEKRVLTEVNYYQSV